jgi:hypothetical protein
MNKTLSTTLTVIAIIALIGIVFFAGSIYARMNAYGLGNMMYGYNWNNNKGYSPNNMMNGRGGNGMGPNMMNGYGYNNANLTPLTIDQAKSAAEKYLANLNNSDLEIAEIMIFDNNAYVVVKETETGLGAFELLVDAVSQTVYPEYGPNMMWNLKYGGFGHGAMMSGNGMMGGTMGGYSGNMMSGWNYQTIPANVFSELTVTSEQAIQYAQEYLDKNYADAIAADDPTQFYGYYTLDFSKDGKLIGMLSVNGYSGQIFLHIWHGTFIEEAESL